MKCIAAKGKSDETTTTSVLSAAENTIPVSDPSGYAVDQYLFISESDDSECECLGKITAIDGSDITCIQGLQGAKGSGAKVWHPTNYCELGYAVDYEDFTDPGIVADTTVGGTPLVNKIADTRDEIQCVIDLIEKAVRANWKSFIENTLSGYKGFTFVNEDGDCWKVYYAGGAIRTVRLKMNHYRSLAVRFMVQSSGADSYE